MKRGRLKAFTIIEVTITMLVAAIVIGITYMAYSIISKSYLSFNAKNKDMEIVEQLDALLKKDFINAELIKKDTGNITFTSTTDTISYQLHPNYILRISSITDTFKVNNEGIAARFEGENIDSLSLQPRQKRIDELELNLFLKDEKIPYHYHKQYSSAQLFNDTTNAVD